MYPPSQVTCNHIPSNRNFPGTEDVNAEQERGTDQMAHHIVYANPESKQAIIAAPFRALGLRCEIFIELSYLIDDRPAPHVLLMRMKSRPGLTHRTVGKYGVTSAESIVAPPYARLMRLVFVTL